MNKNDVSRRRFLQAGSAALTLPLAAAVPVLAQPPSDPHGHGPHHELPSRPARVPNRNLPVRQRGATIIPVDPPTDGVSDCSAVIQAAIDALPEDGGTVLVRYHRTGGKVESLYMMNTTANRQPSDRKAYYALNLRSNILLQLEPGVQLQAMPNNVPRAYMFLLQNVHDVEIAGGAILGERYNHTNSGSGTDEWGFGISISGSTAVTIRSMLISNFEGDGVTIASGGTPSVVPSDVVLWNVVSTSNRRQAVSITQGNGIYLLDSEFSWTHGTAPSDGVDIEGTVSNVFIDHCHIEGNQGNGVELNPGKTGQISNINITNSVLTDNYAALYAASGTTNVMDTCTMYGNAIYQNRWKGLHINGSVTKNFTIGGSSPCDPRNNSFANNQTQYTHQLIYPLSATEAKQGFTGGTDMEASAYVLSPDSNDIFGWNYYYSADETSSPHGRPCEPPAWGVREHDYDHGPNGPKK